MILLAVGWSLRFSLSYHDVAKLISFEEGVKTGTANIALDEHTSINAAPRELQEEYELAQVSGDKERIEEVLTVLWEDYGIHGENPPVREASGIKRLAIMHDDGVNAFGFSGNKEQLVKWMIANRFAGLVCEYNLALYD